MQCAHGLSWLNKELQNLQVCSLQKAYGNLFGFLMVTWKNYEFHYSGGDGKLRYFYVMANSLHYVF